MAALEKVPALDAGAEPMVNKFYFLAKVRLGQEDFALKTYADMEKLGNDSADAEGGRGTRRGQSEKR